MSKADLPLQTNIGANTSPQAPASTPARVLRYLTVRAVVLAATVILGVFAAIFVINYGGFIDDIFRDEISGILMGMGMSMTDVPTAEKFALLEETEQQLIEAYGLNEPFLLRTLRYLQRGLTFDWGESERLESLAGNSREVQTIIMERVPNTLLLFTSSNLLLFFASVFVALYLSRKHNSWLDRVMVFLSPLSSTPNWIFGILLTAVFAAQLHWLPFGGMLDEQPPATRLGYIPIVLKHMILPVTAIFLSTFFASVYSWRTYYLIHAEEDYVDLAKAKGLTERKIEQRYILRPTLPFLITSFTLLLISFWQGAIALEIFFNWPGVGELFIQAIRRLDRPIVIGLVVIFAYLLALSVFLLDIFYVWLDPRVRIGSSGQAVRGTAVTRKRRFRFPWSRRTDSTPAPEPLAPTPVAAPPPPEVPLAQRLRRRWERLKPTLRELISYPSAIVGLIIIFLLVAGSIYTVTTIPYDEAVRRWRVADESLVRNPRSARPEWVNFFRQNDLPPTIIQNSADGTAVKTVEPLSETTTETTIAFEFDYPYTTFPQDLVIFFNAQYEAKQPHIILTWVTPDGRETELDVTSVERGPSAYYLGAAQGSDNRLANRPQEALFADPAQAEPTAVPGTYRLIISSFAFEEGTDVDAEMVLYGQVHGWAGTDNYRRDLTVAMLWGMPVALAFGVLGAVLTSLLTMLIAAVGVWYGGWVDDVIQRLTEINMILPALPIAITVYYVYAKSVWVILGVMVLLSIFGSMLKNYRAMFLQMKEAGYIEAAQAYGASDGRIIRRYMIPRIMPVLIPQLVILVPGFIFLEATLAFLGVSDIYLPTWGKVINDALAHGAFNGLYYWVLEPIALLMLTGLAFAMVGFALDRILNPRLRKI